MKIIVGLGNPGKEYAQTPHNVGFCVVDLLAERWGSPLRRSLRFRSDVAQATLDGGTVLLQKPRTYMNRSGVAVGALARYRKVAPEEIIVVVDDADLDFGRLRIRVGGGSGGHRGLGSILEHLPGGGFVRVRLGIGRSGGDDLVRHVLRPFGESERNALGTVLARAADAVGCVLADGASEAMNRFNGPMVPPVKDGD